MSSKQNFITFALNYLRKNKSLNKGYIQLNATQKTLPTKDFVVNRRWKRKKTAWQSFRFFWVYSFYSNWFRVWNRSTKYQPFKLKLIFRKYISDLFNLKFYKQIKASNFRGPHFINLCFSFYIYFQCRLDYFCIKLHFAWDLLKSKFIIACNAVLINARVISNIDYLVKVKDKIKLQLTKASSSLNFKSYCFHIKKKNRNLNFLEYNYRSKCGILIKLPSLKELIYEFFYIFDKTKFWLTARVFRSVLNNFY